MAECRAEGGGRSGHRYAEPTGAEADSGAIRITLVVFMSTSSPTPSYALAFDVTGRQVAKTGTGSHPDLAWMDYVERSP